MTDEEEAARLRAEGELIQKHPHHARTSPKVEGLRACDSCPVYRKCADMSLALAAVEFRIATRKPK